MDKRYRTVRCHACQHTSMPSPNTECCHYPAGEKGELLTSRSMTDMAACHVKGCGRTVGFHNFNLRIFNLRVSNPNKLIVDVFVDTMSDFNEPGSRQKKTR